MQTKEDLEKFYQVEDPWRYKVTPDDYFRRKVIVETLSLFDWPDRALDIGCGEGWITKNLPGNEVEGFEISDTAASRFPIGLKRANPPTGKYDLVVATGVLYSHYDTYLFMRLIKEHASKYVLVSGIDSWEHPLVKTIGNEIFSARFPYREWHQQLRVFEVQK